MNEDQKEAYADYDGGWKQIINTHLKAMVSDLDYVLVTLSTST